MSKTKSKRFKIPVSQLHKAASIDALAEAIARAFEAANKRGSVRPTSDPEPASRQQHSGGNSGKSVA